MQESHVKTVVRSEHPHDRVNSTKTMYDVGAFEIFWKNLLAGFARAVGGLLIYGAFLFIISSVVAQLFLPQIKPLLNSYQDALDNFNQISNLGGD